MNFPVSIEKNGLQRVQTFLNESNRIESITELDYRRPELQDPERGHFGAFILSQNQAVAHEPLDAKKIRKWQELVTREQPKSVHIDDEAIGHIRGPSLKRNVRIGSHLPPSWEHVPTLLQCLIEDINEGLKDQEALKEDDVFCEFLGNSFQKFMAIHPFADGNGRVGRLLANYILTYCGRPIMVFNSEMIERNRYYDAHKTKKLMGAFMAGKLKEAIFGIDGALLNQKEVLSGSTCRYEDREGSETECYEWHKLDSKYRFPEQELAK